MWLKSYHQSTVIYTTPLELSHVEFRPTDLDGNPTSNWSWTLDEGDFGGVFLENAINDLRIEAFHEVGPHGELPHNGPIGGVMFDVPAPGDSSTSPYWAFRQHGIHLDTLRVDFLGISENATEIKIELRHDDIPEPVSIMLMAVAGACLLHRRNRVARS